MMLPFITFISLLLICPSWGGMSSREFETFIEPMCFRLDEKEIPYVNGQENPLASTLENFIALAEKFEIANPTKSLKEELFYFIRNYTYPNIEYNSLGDIVRWNPKDSNYVDIETMWEQDENMRKYILPIEDPFTDAEKCSLYFMISHSIVRTPRKIEVQRSMTFNNDTSDDKKKNGETVFKYDDLFPQEQGVVAIQGTEEAVSLSRVLTGMYVGLNQGRKKDIDSFERIPKEYIPLQGTIVDPLYTLTIAEVIGMSAWRPEAGQRQLLATNGRWISVPVGSDIETSNVCPMIYRLIDGTEHAYSYSSMRGAADGLILGRVSGEIESRKRDAKLSQILRQYYSRGGLVEKTPDMGEIRASFCNREHILESLDDMIKDQTKLFLLLASTSYKNIDDSLSFAWTKYGDAKRLGVLKNINRGIMDYCGETLQVEKPENWPIESPLDVIAVVDTNTIPDYFKRQQLILGSMARRLSLSYYGSRMTVFTDQKVSPTANSAIINLRTIVDDTYSPACAACAVTQIERDPSPSCPEDEVIIALHQYLTVRKENETKYNGVNGKVIILFNFDEDVPAGKPSASENRLVKALRDLHFNHTDARVYVLGKNLEVLKKYSKNDPSFLINAFEYAEEEMGRRLYDKIIAAPAKLQYPDCANGRAEKSAVFEDFISPNSIQHWEIPAEYFHKSYKLKVSFESVYGAAKVCHSRSTISPELQRDSCRNIEGGKPLEFTHDNPCKGFSPTSCAPFFFSILGINVTDGTDKDYCDDKTTENKCRTLDQIKFKVSHEGIRCSGSVGLFAPPSFVILAMILSYIFSKFA